MASLATPALREVSVMRPITAIGELKLHRPALLGLAMVLAGTAVAAAQSRTARLPAQIPVQNARAANLVEMTIQSADGTALAQLAQPLAPGKRVNVKLARGQGCTVAVLARFDDEAEIEGSLDLCREKIIRLVD
jgi:hypothetical protein